MKIDDITKKRVSKKFQECESTSHLDPRDALIQALAEIDNKDISPYHIIVIVGEKNDTLNKIGLRYFSAGPLDYWGHLGLLDNALHAIRNS